MQARRIIAIVIIGVLLVLGACASPAVTPVSPSSNTTPPAQVSPVPPPVPVPTPPVTTSPTPVPTPPVPPPNPPAPKPSLALYVPNGQQFTGGIQTQGDGQTTYFVDKAPFCAYGGAPVSGYTWSLGPGSTLPPGTTFDPTTGMFYQGGSGVAIVPGTHTFKMVVSDGFTTATGTFSLVINTGPILPTAIFQKSLAADIPLPDANTGMGYGVSLRAIGNGALPWAWNIMTGQLPPGLGINQSSGVIYGTPLPSAAGKTYKFSINVKDGMGMDAIGEPTYSISVPK